MNNSRINNKETPQPGAAPAKAPAKESPSEQTEATNLQQFYLVSPPQLAVLREFVRSLALPRRETDPVAMLLDSLPSGQLEIQQP